MVLQNGYIIPQSKNFIIYHINVCSVLLLFKRDLAFCESDEIRDEHSDNRFHVVTLGWHQIGQEVSVGSNHCWFLQKKKPDFNFLEIIGYLNQASANNSTGDRYSSKTHQ